MTHLLYFFLMQSSAIKMQILHNYTKARGQLEKESPNTMKGDATNTKNFPGIKS